MYLPTKIPDDERPASAKPGIDPVSRALLEAARKIKEGGWYAGLMRGYTGGTTPSCALNAIGDACDLANVPPLPAWERFAAHIGIDTWENIPVWNDEQRNAEVVIAALEAAATIRA